MLQALDGVVAFAIKLGDEMHVDVDNAALSLHAQHYAAYRVAQVDHFGEETLAINETREELARFFAKLERRQWRMMRAKLFFAAQVNGAVKRFVGTVEEFLIDFA